jgi:hypothetical protein
MGMRSEDSSRRTKWRRAAGASRNVSRKLSMARRARDIGASSTSARGRCASGSAAMATSAAPAPPECANQTSKRASLRGQFRQRAHESRQRTAHAAAGAVSRHVERDLLA